MQVEKEALPDVSVGQAHERQSGLSRPFTVWNNAESPSFFLHRSDVEREFVTLVSHSDQPMLAIFSHAVNNRVFSRELFFYFIVISRIFTALPKTVISVSFIILSRIW